MGCSGRLFRNIPCKSAGWCDIWRWCFAFGFDGWELVSVETGASIMRGPRWRETDTTIDDDGNVIKQLKDQAPPTEGEISKAEYAVERSKKPLLLYWSDDVPIDETPAIFFYLGFERRPTEGDGVIERRVRVLSEKLTYAEARKLAPKLRGETS
jgi:hypothetical protein